MAALLRSARIDRLLDADGDIVIGQFSSDLAGVAQAVRIAMQMRKGEWFMNLDLGVPYYERDGVAEDEAVLGQPYDAGKLEAAFRAVALTVPDVLAITQLSSTFDAATRAVTVTWAATTTFGDTPVDLLAVTS